MFQVLLKRRLIKLSEEPRLGGRIEYANFIDELTFRHNRLLSIIRLTLRAGLRPRRAVDDSSEVQLVRSEDTCRELERSG